MESLRDRQLALARQVIIGACAELVTERRHLDFAMKDVAERSGVSLRTVYNPLPSFRPGRPAGRARARLHPKDAGAGRADRRRPAGGRGSGESGAGQPRTVRGAERCQRGIRPNADGGGGPRRRATGAHATAGRPPVRADARRASWRGPPHRRDASTPAQPPQLVLAHPGVRPDDRPGRRRRHLGHGHPDRRRGARRCPRRMEQP